MEPTTVSYGLMNGLHTGLYQYSLAIQPDEDLSKKIEQEKIFLKERISDIPQNNTSAHIALATFQARDRMEETLIRYMERVTSSQESFTLALNNYSSNSSQNIFIRVQNPQRVRLLNHQLNVVNGYIKSCSCPTVNFVQSPHLVLAERLGEVNYLQAMFECSQRSFFETLTVSELVLLRRSHHLDAWKKVHLFRLQPPAYTAFQNNLYC